jgi:hypothetical protein
MSSADTIGADMSGAAVPGADVSGTDASVVGTTMVVGVADSIVGIDTSSVESDPHAPNRSANGTTNHNAATR